MVCRKERLRIPERGAYHTYSTRALPLAGGEVVMVMVAVDVLALQENILVFEKIANSSIRISCYHTCDLSWLL